jgi:hypothetical protein
MRRKASAGFGLCVERVPVAYHRLLLGVKNISHLLQHLDLILDPPEFLGPRLRHALIIIFNIILVDYRLCLCLSLL